MGHMVGEGVTQQQLMTPCKNEALTSSSPGFWTTPISWSKCQQPLAIPAPRSCKLHAKRTQTLMAIIILCLSTYPKHDLNSTKAFLKVGRFNKYGWNFQRIQIKKKFISFWTREILIKPTDGGFGHFSQRVQAWVLQLNHIHPALHCIVSWKWSYFVHLRFFLLLFLSTFFFLH